MKTFKSHNVASDELLAECRSLNLLDITGMVGVVGSADIFGRQRVRPGTGRRPMRPGPGPATPRVGFRLLQVRAGSHG